MNTMYILTKTENKDYIERLEQKLLLRFNKDSKTNKCINQCGGGEGMW